MREVRVIDQERELVHLGNNTAYFKRFLSEYDRREYLRRHANLVKQAWKSSKDDVECSMTMLCLDGEMEKGPPFYDSHIIGFYNFDFDVSPDGRMHREADEGVIIVFEPFRGHKYGSFLLDNMIDFLKGLDILHLSFFPEDIRIEKALLNRGYKKYSSGYMRQF